MKTHLTLAALLGTSALACSGPDTGQPAPALGSSGANMIVEHYSESDVVGFHFIVEQVACPDEDPAEVPAEVIEANVDLIAGLMPGMVELLEQRLDSRSKHVGSDLFISLAPGCYDVTAVPASHIDGDEWVPSTRCAATSLDEPVEVLPGETAEPPLMISQCIGDPTAQLDTPVALNQPPTLELRLEDDKFSLQCSPVTVCATFSDPNDDPIELDYARLEGAPHFALDVGEAELVGFEEGRRIWEQCATITNQAIGRYEYRVTAYDLGLRDGEEVRMEELTGEDSSITTTFPLYITRSPERRCIDEDGDAVWADAHAEVERAEGCAFETDAEYYCGDAFAAEDPEAAAFLCPDGALDEEALYPRCD